MSKTNGNSHTPVLLNFTERLQDWAKYRGKGKLVATTDDPAVPQVIVAHDPEGRHGPAGGIVVFVQTAALYEIRTKWEGLEIDTIPSDDEVAAWLIWMVLDKAGDDGRIQES